MGLRSFFGRAKKAIVNVEDMVTVKEISDKEVRSLFELWNDALQTGSSKLVAKRYSKDPPSPYCFGC